MKSRKILALASSILIIFLLVGSSQAFYFRPIKIIELPIDIEKPRADLSVYNLWVEKGGFIGDDITLHWDANPNATEYHIYHTEDPYTPWESWSWIGNTTNNYYSDSGALGGDDYYIVRAYSGTTEGPNSTMGYVEENFYDSDYLLYYTSVPNGMDYNGDGSLTSFDVIESITGSLTTRGNLARVVKWNSQDRDYQYFSYFNMIPGLWESEFDIDPGDGIGLEIDGDITWYVNATSGPHPTQQWNQTFYDSEYNLHYTSLEYDFYDYTNDGQLTSLDVVNSIEGDLNSSTKIMKVVKWDASTRGYSEVTFWDGITRDWYGEFSIDPSDCIGLMIIDDLNWGRETVTPVISK
ncbi:MAG: hypothetical protein R6U61_08060 [Thermoplasmata archaeon]